MEEEEEEEEGAVAEQSAYAADTVFVHGHRPVVTDKIVDRPLLSTICMSYVSPAGLQTVPGASAMVSDQMPEAQRCQHVIMQFHLPSAVQVEPGCMAMSVTFKFSYADDNSRNV